MGCATRELDAHVWPHARSSSWRGTSFGKPNAVAAVGCSSAPIGLAATIHHLLAASACGHGQMTRPCCLHRHSQKNGCGGCACGSKRGYCGRCGFPILARVGRAKTGLWRGSWCLLGVWHHVDSGITGRYKRPVSVMKPCDIRFRFGFWALRSIDRSHKSRWR